jgi:WD40 repeat protein
MLAFNTNGDLLASTSEDRTVRLWRLPSGDPVGSPFQTPNGWLGAVLRHDGKLLATTATQLIGRRTNSLIQTWDVATGASIGPSITMEGETKMGTFVSPNGQRLFALTDKENGLFDAESHERLLPPIETDPGVIVAAISKDGRRVAFGGDKGLAGVWNLETGERLISPCLRDRTIVHVEFSPDGSQLLASSENGTATLLSMRLPASASYRFDAAMGNRAPQPLLLWRRFSPDRQRFLLILMDGTVRLVDFERMTDQRISNPKFAGLTPYQCTFDTSGHRGAIAYSGAGTNLVEIWSEEEHATNWFVLPHPVGLNDKMLFTSDGSRLITPGGDRQIRFWRTADGSLERSLPMPEELLDKVELFPDGRTAFNVRSEENRFVLLDLITGAISNTPMPPFEITEFTFDSKGDGFATATTEKWGRVWSTRTGEPLTPRLHHGGVVRWTEFSPDGKRVVTAGLTPEAKVWDASTGEQLLPPLCLGSKPLEAALWSLDGRFIVARSDENSVRVWDAATGEPVTPVLQHSSYIRLAHLVAKNRLVTLSLPNLMRAWDLIETHLTAAVIADYAKLVSGRRLDAAGVVLSLKPDELAELCRSLRARVPQLFE